MAIKKKTKDNLSAKEKLTKAKFKFLTNGNLAFWGALALRFRYIEDEMAGGQKTTAVTPDGKFYYNKEHIESLTIDDCVFEVAHEIGHIVQEVFGRFPVGGNHQLWNTAADIVVDTMLVKSGLQQSQTSVDAGINSEVIQWADKRTTENIYYMLMEQNPEVPQSVMQVLAQCQGQPQDDGGNGGQQQQPGGGGGDEDPCPQGKGHSPVRGCCTATLHDGTPNPQDVENIRKMVLEAYHQTKDKGDMPGLIGDMISELTTPTVNWKDHIRSTLQSSFKGRYSFKRPSRSQPRGYRLPSRMPIQQGVACMVDTSGSMSDGEIIQALTEMDEMMRAFKIPFMRVFFHDVECYYDARFTRDDFTKIKCSRGGTSHRPVFERMYEVIEEEQEKIGALVCFTDLYTDFPDEAPPFPVIWGANPGNNAGEVPWGKIVEVDIFGQEGS